MNVDALVVPSLLGTLFEHASINRVPSKLGTTGESA